MAWKTIERPGHFGERRDQILEEYDRRFGSESWRIAWEWEDDFLDYLGACKLYEEAYYEDSFKREDLWRDLARTASEVYDHDPSDVASGLDYLVQNSGSTHIQDITIRRVLDRRGWPFEGKELIQIRSHAKYWGERLSPGRVPFHLPEGILIPRLTGWWDEDSVEDFYQSNKVLQARV